MGLLTITGTLNVKQFWPDARSDADTATVVLAAKDAFVFVDDAGKRHVTKAFVNAEVQGKHGGAAVIKRPKKGGAHITVRLQGVDAPELHYQPTVTGAKKGVTHPFRQSLGETCAAALHDYVGKLGQGEIPCAVVTAVDKPNDVCDVFGRVVGNLVLRVGGARVDVNHWLLREGWVLPGLYNSMSKAEIRAVLADHDAAVQGRRGLFSESIVTHLLAAFDPTRVERKKPAGFKAFGDKGPVNFPKFFRRQAEHHVRLASNPAVPAALPAFLATKADDVALGTDAFLKLTGPVVGKKPRKEFQNLATFVTQNKYPTGEELVFWENDSVLTKADGKTPITKW